MNTSNRREFLRNAAIGSASVATGLFPGRVFSENVNDAVNVRYRNLGSTGYMVSEVGFGAMNTRDEELIQAAIDSGINYIDTAHGYMKGENEKIVGRVINRNARDKIFVVTKVFHRNKNPKELREMMELSLKRLGLDYVDIMFIHMSHTRDVILNDDYIKCFEQARKDGLCRFVGISTHTNQAECLDCAVESKFWEAVLVAYNFTAGMDDADRGIKLITPAIERARKAGLAIIAMKTQAKGTGMTDHDMGDINAQQAALKWVLQNDYVDTTIPGMTAFEQLNEDLSVMGMKLSLNDRRKLYHYGKSLEVKYCRGVAGCTGCQDQCPKGVEICELNRCIGYANGYGNLELARENYDQLPPESRVDVCSDCDECKVQCVNGLNLTETVKKARALFA